MYIVYHNSGQTIFIDWYHTYPYVMSDLQFWYRKDRLGGQILGDDYWMTDVSKDVQTSRLFGSAK